MNMKTTKRSLEKTSTKDNGGPSATRPHIPGYGIPEDKKGLLSWSHVVDRMAAATHYWICTVDPGGRPHATPVDGLWLEDRFYFGGSTQTRRHRNLIANASVCVHLESATDVIILQGDARELRDPDRDLTTRLSQASRQKYGYGPGPEDYAKGGVFVLQPRVAFAWSSFPKDATRWSFQNRIA
jgi:nitroimidazol reductase NimA-like FMN-containing flavoprotein (pyridoxamine 5'-phosphate oxidase superfamily)